MEFEDLLQIVRLVLLDGSKFDEPEMTLVLQDLSKSVPTLFAIIFPRYNNLYVNEADAEDMSDLSASPGPVGKGVELGP